MEKRCGLSPSIHLTCLCLQRETFLEYPNVDPLRVVASVVVVLRINELFNSGCSQLTCFAPDWAQLFCSESRNISIVNS